MEPYEKIFLNEATEQACIDKVLSFLATKKIVGKNSLQVSKANFTIKLVDKIAINFSESERVVVKKLYIDNFFRFQLIEETLTQVLQQENATPEQLMVATEDVIKNILLKPSVHEFLGTHEIFEKATHSVCLQLSIESELFECVESIFLYLFENCFFGISQLDLPTHIETVSQPKPKVVKEKVEEGNLIPLFG